MCLVGKVGGFLEEFDAILEEIDGLRVGSGFPEPGKVVLELPADEVGLGWFSRFTDGNCKDWFCIGLAGVPRGCCSGCRSPRRSCAEGSFGVSPRRNAIVSPGDISHRYSSTSFMDSLSDASMSRARSCRVIGPSTALAD